MKITPSCVKTSTFRQYFATISGSFCYALVGMSVAWPSPTLIKMRNNETPIILDITEISWMVSLMFVGHVMSPIPTGYLMDKFGRKTTCLCLAVLPLISWLLILFASTPVYLYVARYAAGLWAGIITTVIPIYIGEISEPDIRGPLTTFNNLFMNVGVLFSYVIAPYVTYSAFAIICAIVTVIYFCIFLWMPESPYYLMMHDQRKSACESLKWLRAGKAPQDIEEEVEHIKMSVELQMSQKGSLRDILFNKVNRKAFIISEMYSVLRRFAGTGVLQAYVSITLPEVTFKVLHPNECVIILGVVSLLASVAAVFLTADFRRRTLVTVSCCGGIITMATIMAWFYLDSNTSINVDNYSYLIFVSFVIYNASFAIGLGPVGTSIKGEMFSSNVKALSSSLITVSVAISSFILNKFYLIIAQSIGMYVNYLIFAVSCAIIVVFTWTYVPETQGKTLQEIQEVLKSSKHRNYNATSS